MAVKITYLESFILYKWSEYEKTKSTLMASVFLIFSVPAYAEPSYDETLSFLKSKLNTITKSVSSLTNKKVRYQHSFRETSRCFFRYDQEVDGEVFSYEEYNAGDIDPSSVETIDEEVYAKSYDNKNKIRINGTWDNNTMRFYRILSPSLDNARRVADAFRHLIKLCGGKEQLF